MSEDIRARCAIHTNNSLGIVEYEGEDGIRTLSVGQCGTCMKNREKWAKDKAISAMVLAIDSFKLEDIMKIVEGILARLSPDSNLKIAEDIVLSLGMDRLIALEGTVGTQQAALHAREGGKRDSGDPLVMNRIVKEIVDRSDMLRPGGVVEVANRIVKEMDLEALAEFDFEISARMSELEAKRKESER